MCLANWAAFKYSVLSITKRNLSEKNLVSVMSGQTIKKHFQRETGVRTVMSILLGCESIVFMFTVLFA